MKLVTLTAALLAFLGSSARAYILVEDIPKLTQDMLHQIANYAQYLEQTAQQILTVENQVTQIEYQLIAMERVGTPSYYVNMLHLDELVSTASELASGVGQTASEFQQAANGVSALGYTAGGLYSNLTGSLDRWGNPVRYDTDAFRKFGAVNDMADAYDRELRSYNQQSASLQQQLQEATARLNQESTQEGRARLHAQIEDIHTEIDASGHHLAGVGQRVLVQQALNQNDASRVMEAQRQQRIQEREQDVNSFARNLGNWIGGAP
jgi:uncharacterized phage infection (PIP) family protein YhgE